MAGNTYVNITPEGKTVKKIVITVVIVLAVIILGFSSFAIVSPGHTGVVVTLVRYRIRFSKKEYILSFLLFRALNR